MNMNPMKLMKLKTGLETFNKNHPRVQPFFKAVSQEAMMEGTIIEIIVTTPDGKTMTSNVKIQQSDLDLFQSLGE